MEPKGLVRLPLPLSLKTPLTSRMSGPFDGNAEFNHTAFDSGVVQFADPISGGSTLRLVFDAQNAGHTTGYVFGLDNVLFRIVAAGDTNGNGEVNSDDLFNIPAGGKYNHPKFGTATWIECDFSGDDLVNSTDLFLVLATGKYNQGPYTTATPPAALAASPNRPASSLP